MEIDNYNQWFVSIGIEIGEKRINIEFKVDTGCLQVHTLILPKIIVL